MIMHGMPVPIVFAVILGSLAVLAGPASAQPVQGDLVVTSDHKGSWSGAGIFYVTWPSTTLKTLRSSLTTNAVEIDHSNTGVMVIGTNTGTIYKVNSQGEPTTLTTYAHAGGVGMELDQDRTYMVVNFTDSRMYRLTTAGGVSTFLSFTATHGQPNAICRDNNSGDWIVGTSKGLLLRVDRKTAYISTIRSGLGAVYDVEFMDQTGEFAVIQNTGLSIIRSTGSIRYSCRISYANAVTVNNRTGAIFVATYLNRQIVELTPSASIVRTRAYNTPSNLQFTGIDIWADRTVHAFTSGERGARVDVILRFPASPDKPYAVALSMKQRPGIAFGAKNVLNLTLDPVFLLTAAGGLPYWTTGFSGTTYSGSGLAFAGFTIPWGLPAGSCIYVGAAAINSSAPNNLDVGNVVAIQVS